MMASVVSERELFRSCEILFGLELTLSREFLVYLQHSGVKSAYRQKARETHPDLAADRSDTEKKQLADLFVAVHGAYENLKAYLEARENGYRIPTDTTATPSCSRSRQARPNNGPPARPAKAEARSGFSTAGGRSHTAWSYNTTTKHQGPIPNRRLLFGHFLYYSGEISWRDIVQALVWQRTQRPRLGEIGRRLGWLTERDILTILERRTPTRPFGATAVMLGILTGEQLNALILRQKRLQKKIGGYFIESGQINTQRLHHLIVRHQFHNSRVAESASAGRWAS